MDETIKIISYMCQKSSTNIGWVSPWIHQTIGKKNQSFINVKSKGLSSCVLVNFIKVDTLLRELASELNHGR
jgi:hypothetical protein